LNRARNPTSASGSRTGAYLEGLRLGLFALGILCWTVSPAAGANVCEICGGPLGNEAFIVQDRVTRAQRKVCSECELSNTRCFICGLPARSNYTELPDSRVLCERDAATAVLKEQDGLRYCRETRQRLGQLFWKFLTFPETNVSISMIDRIHLQEQFRFPGNDRPCPNIWGRLRTQTSGAGLRHEMSLLSGLPLAGFNATCAHEYAHVWLNENLSAARRKTISSDAVEGFCELIAYLLMDAEMENGQKEWIKLNAYTRGQIELFIEAEQLYGFNDVLKWIRYGTDDRLSGDELGRLRRVELPQPTAPPLRELANAANPHSVARETLTLKAIFWNQQQSLAIINDQTFGLQQQREVRLGPTNVALRCLEIRKDRVRVKIVGTGQEQELVLRIP